MPKPSPYALIWSEEQHYYEVRSHGAHGSNQPPMCFRPSETQAFSQWLAEHSAFAFVGKAGRLSVTKEGRSRGDGYWYAYRRQDRRTRKRYLGRTAKVTLARLEQVALLLARSPAPAPLAPEPLEPLSEQNGAVLASKLSLPRLPIVLVERPRLLTELDAIRTRPVTLISASAGSGKTTLLSAWAATFLQESQDRSTDPTPALAWLSLEASDNDPIRFWTALVAAVCTCLPNMGAMTLAMLRAQETPPLSTILTHLLHELGQIHTELILILDDYHVIEDQVIHESIRFFIEHLFPTVHVVLATCADPELPLSRWRMRDEMNEIRSSDLRFTQVEAQSYLSQRMGLALSVEDVATLVHRTEGWIAGLQLAALAMRKQQDLPGFVQDFAGSYRYLLDYVRQDILAQLPDSLQRFLLETSLVSRMNAALCQAITAGASPQASQEILEELQRANLFVVPLDERRQWYRYHDLFREALRARLHATQPERVPLLHIRAARWYETKAEWREAVEHALAARDYHLAAYLMEQAAPHLWRCGEASTVQNWVVALPDIVLRAHARLAFNAALRFLNSVHISAEIVHANMAAQVERTIVRMEAILSSEQSLEVSEAETALIERRVRLLRALIEVRAYFTHADTERLRTLTAEVEALPPDDEVSWRMIPLTFAFWLTLALQQESSLLIPRLRSAKQWISEARDHLATFRVMTWLARSYIHAGRLQQARQECRAALALLDKFAGSIAIAGYLFSSLFDIYYTWNRLDEASSALHHLLQIAQDWRQVELLAIGKRGVAQLALARGDLASAQDALQEAETLLEQEEFANNARWVLDTRVQVWLAQGRLTEASDWAARAIAARATGDPLRTWEVLLVVRVALAQQQYARAVELLEGFKERLDQFGDMENRLEWMALYVVALHHAGKTVDAARIAGRLFALTGPEGYIRIFLDAGEPMRQTLVALLDGLRNRGVAAKQAPGSVALVNSIPRSYVLKLLTEFARDGRQHTSKAGMLPASQHEIRHGPETAELQWQGVELLSPQERRVLRLLVAGQTYAEIASALIVSPNTVKTQVSSIYRKLGVSRRADAIAVAAGWRLT